MPALDRVMPVRGVKALNCATHHSTQYAQCMSLWLRTSIVENSSKTVAQMLQRRRIKRLFFGAVAPHDGSRRWLCLMRVGDCD